MMQLALQPDATEIVEGKARLVLRRNTLAQTMKPFYNPKMSLNRDLAVLFSQSYFAALRQIRLCDPMTGTGVRAVRYALESSIVKGAIAADRDPQTVEIARETVRLNDLEERISVVESDANLLLLSHAKERFDLIDLDPFGSPAPFFESALRTTIDGGIVAATATDMGPLSGARRAACARKYGVTPVRTEFEKEIAARILAGCMAVTAGRLELGINVVFTHATDHYVRIYVVVLRGKTSANLSARSLGFLEYCPNCLKRESRASLETVRTTCEECSSKTSLGGPIWLGQLWNRDIVKGMAERSVALVSTRISEVQKLLSYIEGECDAPPFYYRTDMISSKLRIKPPRMMETLAALRENDYKATRTHFDPNAFRTDAPNREIATIIRRSANEA